MQSDTTDGLGNTAFLIDLLGTIIAFTIAFVLHVTGAALWNP